MRELTKHEKKTLKNIFDELCTCSLYMGTYDARHGNDHFMYGINSVMSTLASMISEEEEHNFNKTFFENMIYSEEKAKGE